MKHFLKFVLICLTGAMFLAEILSSPVTRSLTLLISAYHMLYNFLSFLLLFISEKFSQRKSGTKTYGCSRLNDFGHLLISLFTGFLCLTESTQLMKITLHASHEDKEPRYPGLIISLGFVDLTLNIICFIFLGGYTHQQICSAIINNEKNNKIISDPEDKTTESSQKKEVESSVSLNVPPDREFSFFWNLSHQILDVFCDVSSCLLVIICGYAILLSDACGVVLRYVDAIFALLALTALIRTIYPLMKKCCLIVLQTIPNNIDIEDLKKKLEREFPNVLDIHDFHVWQLSSTEIVATLHIIMASQTIDNGIVEILNRFLFKEGIKRVTVQLELAKTVSSGNTKLNCLLECSSSNKCVAQTCCGPLRERRTKFYNGRGSIPSRQDSNEDALSSSASNSFVLVPVTDSNILGSCGYLTKRKMQSLDGLSEPKTSVPASSEDVLSSTTSTDSPSAHISAADSDTLVL